MEYGDTTAANRKAVTCHSMVSSVFASLFVVDLF
jgi:hypothetical protein